MRDRPARIGEILVHMGVLTTDQCERALELQDVEGGAFGQIVENLFGVPPEAVERAWATQYALLSGTIDPGTIRPEVSVLSLVQPRQAWQFGVLPIRLSRGEVELCATEETLPRALRFTAWGLPHACSFLVATSIRDFERALTRWYPEGMGLAPGGLQSA
ncbi:MAG: hypothetical protein RBS39_01190 [Phycisphaerales bacterium]|jgi:hypothetical protein|nr:hypothetical protein [Phycisphaerales bacterium]